MVDRRGVGISGRGFCHLDTERGNKDVMCS